MIKDEQINVVLTDDLAYTETPEKRFQQENECERHDAHSWYMPEIQQTLYLGNKYVYNTIDYNFIW